MTDLFGLSTMASNTQFAPLARLGYRLHQRDFFGLLREQVQRPQKVSCTLRMTSYSPVW
jgi:hypothetical protein